MVRHADFIIDCPCTNVSYGFCTGNLIKLPNSGPRNPPALSICQIASWFAENLCVRFEPRIGQGRELDTAWCSRIAGKRHVWIRQQLPGTDYTCDALHGVMFLSSPGAATVRENEKMSGISRCSSLDPLTHRNLLIAAFLWTDTGQRVWDRWVEGGRDGGRR